MDTRQMSECPYYEVLLGCYWGITGVLLCY